MRISIWQQWASNHSVSFTVVGEFESAEAAQKAASELHYVMHTIVKWYRQLPPEAFGTIWRRGEDPPSPTPPEIALSKQYGVEWSEYAIDWLADGWTSGEERPYPVWTYDRLVFVSTGDTGSFGEPFDRLIARLGGQPTVYLDEGSHLDVNLSCTAPDDTTADMLLMWFRNRLDEAAQVGGRWWEVPTCQPDITPSKGSVRLEGRRLYLSDFRLDVIDNLLTLFAFLEESGCTEMSYMLSQGK